MCVCAKFKVNRANTEEVTHHDFYPKFFGQKAPLWGVMNSWARKIFSTANDKNGYTQKTTKLGILVSHGLTSQRTWITLIPVDGVGHSK